MHTSVCVSVIWEYEWGRVLKYGYMKRVSGEQGVFLIGPNPRSLTEPLALEGTLKTISLAWRSSEACAGMSSAGGRSLAEGRVVCRHTASD